MDDMYISKRSYWRTECVEETDIDEVEEVELAQGQVQKQGTDNNNSEWRDHQSFVRSESRATIKSDQQDQQEGEGWGPKPTNPTNDWQDTKDQEDNWTTI